MATENSSINLHIPTLKSVFLNDLICGSFAGLAYILTAHPLDSIKVRL